jgi:hypothetical protein
MVSKLFQTQTAKKMEGPLPPEPPILNPIPVYSPHYVIIPLKGQTGEGMTAALIQKFPNYDEAMKVYMEATDKRVPLVILAKEVRAHGEG